MEANETTWNSDIFRGKKADDKTSLIAFSSKCFFGEIAFGSFLHELVLLALFTTLFQVSLLSPLSVSKQTNHEETRGINPMNLPISLGWLVQDNSMKHCHVVMQPNCVAHQGLTQAQKL
jgi:hypothetical protein